MSKDNSINTKNFVENMEDLIPSINDSGYSRVLAVGDIHGCYDKLMSLLDKVNVQDSDLLIMLGNYIDRGKEVDKVLKWIMANKDRKNFIFFRTCVHRNKVV